MNGIQHAKNAKEAMTYFRENKHPGDSVDVDHCKTCGKQEELGVVAWMVNNGDWNPTFCFSCFDKAAPIVRGGPYLCSVCLDPIATEVGDISGLAEADLYPERDIQVYSADTRIYAHCKRHFDRCAS